MRKSCSVSLGRVGSEGVGGAGTEEGRAVSVVAMLFLVRLGDTVIVVGIILCMRVLEKARIGELLKRACVGRRFSSLMVFIRSQRWQCNSE